MAIRNADWKGLLTGDIVNLNFTRFSRASGVGFSRGVGLYGVRLLNGLRGPLIKCGVPTVRVVPTCHLAEERKSGFGLRGKAMHREALDLESGEEALLRS